jgi:hypothetical protein
MSPIKKARKYVKEPPRKRVMAFKEYSRGILSMRAIIHKHPHWKSQPGFLYAFKKWDSAQEAKSSAVGSKAQADWGGNLAVVSAAVVKERKEKGTKARACDAIIAETSVFPNLSRQVTNRHIKNGLAGKRPRVP